MRKPRDILNKCGAVPKSCEHADTEVHEGRLRCADCKRYLDCVSDDRDEPIVPVSKSDGAKS